MHQLLSYRHLSPITSLRFLSILEIKNSGIKHKSVTSLNFEQALNHLKEKNINDLFNCNDPNILTNVLIEKLTETIQNNTTIRNMPYSKRLIKP